VNGLRPDPALNGFAELPGRNFAVANGGYVDFGVPVPLSAEAGSFMHELGHNFGLQHGGSDFANWKPNYISVMNYAYELNGIVLGIAPGSREIRSCTAHSDCGSGALCELKYPDFGTWCFRTDYSSRALPGLNELVTPAGLGGLDENVGVSGAPGDADLVFYWTPGLSQRIGPSYGPIDWNGDGVSTGVNVAADINNDGFYTFLRGFDDWSYVKAQIARGHVPSRAEVRIVHEWPVFIDLLRRRR
jgi:hypothetical protein